MKKNILRRTLSFTVDTPSQVEITNHGDHYELLVKNLDGLEVVALPANLEYTRLRGLELTGAFVDESNEHDGTLPLAT